METLFSDRAIVSDRQRLKLDLIGCPLAIFHSHKPTGPWHQEMNITCIIYQRSISIKETEIMTKFISNNNNNNNNILHSCHTVNKEYLSQSLLDGRSTSHELRIIQKFSKILLRTKLILNFIKATDDLRMIFNYMHELFKYKQLLINYYI